MDIGFAACFFIFGMVFMAFGYTPGKSTEPPPSKKWHYVGHLGFFMVAVGVVGAINGLTR